MSEYNNLPENTAYTTNDIQQKKFNAVTGFIGAIIGSIPGCLLWLLLAHFGFIAGIAGYAIMMGSIFVADKFGGNCMPKGGIVMCIIVTCLMIFGTNCLDYAISFYQMFIEEGVSLDFTRVLTLLPYIITDSEVAGGFVMNLIIGYGLTALSCYKTVGLMF